MPASRGVAADRPALLSPPWWLCILAATFAGYYALLLFSDLTRPEPAGFIFEFQDAAMMLRSLAPDSPADRGGLKVGDHVLRANDRPVRNRLDWLSIEMNLQAGQPIRLDIIREGQARTVLVNLARVSQSFWKTRAGGTLLVVRAAQLVTLMLAFFVGFKRRFDRSALIGAWALATIAVYSIVLPYQIAVTWRNLPAWAGLALWIPFVSSLSVAAVIFTFFAVFPRPIVRTRWVWVVIWIPMAAASLPQLQFFAQTVYRPERGQGLVDWTTSEVAVTAFYTVAALMALILGYRRLTDLTERRRMRVLVLGSVVGLLSILPIVSAYWGRSGASLGDSVFGSPVVAVGAILGLAFPMSFVYAVLRHRLFDIGFIVRRGLQYALARSVLVSTVPAASVLFLLDLWIHRDIPFIEVLQARGWGYVALVGAAMVARLRRAAWLDSLDRRFFRERHSAEQILRRIGADVRRAPSLEAVAASVVVQLDAALHPRFTAIGLRRADQRVYRLIAKVPTSFSLEPISSACKLVGLLKLLQRPVQVPAAEGAGLLPELPKEELEWLHRSALELLVPIRVGSDASDAMLMLGPKRSEEPYSAEDEDLLMAVANSLEQVLSRQETDVTSQLLGGRYRLDQEIGRGGMGTVYAAVDTALQRPVAVKLLREDVVGGPFATERFQSEARLAAALVHPNVVTVHDIGVSASGRAFFVMELLQGTTLREELQRAGPLAEHRVLSIMRGIASAVDAAHTQQMIHRDLKPENVFLCGQGAEEVPKVLDFGLAKALEMSGSSATMPPPTGVRLTEAGQIFGTPQYMAPEHWRGGEPSADWDLWALAVIAFEVTTGALPFEAVGKMPRFDELKGSLPSVPLRRLFVRALALDPLDRPTSGQELVDELERAMQEQHAPQSTQNSQRH